MNAPQTMQAYVTRFTVKQRIEHFAIMVVFTLLVVTGMPQKFYTVGFSKWVVDALGGIDSTRLIHRWCGYVFSFLVVAHLGIAVWQLMTRRLKHLYIVPGKQDFVDAIKTLRYYLGIAKEPAKFDRYDYKQKFEYWGMVAGGGAMIVTGFMLKWPALFATYLPGQLIPAAKTLHSYEGLMAMLVIVVWHLYNAHLNPDVFPVDWSIFSGKISRHRMEEEHPLELARMEGAGEKKAAPRFEEQSPPAP
ncbi:MAG: formate dehydrogenase subunit gamma [Myxococcales bacterium]